MAATIFSYFRKIGYFCANIAITEDRSRELRQDGQGDQTDHIARGHTISLIIDVNNTADLDADHLRDIDVAIEFTTPQTAYGNIVKCIEAGVPVVCGTTAWLDKLPEVEQLCKTKQGAFFYASNYSIGVNIF